VNRCRLARRSITAIISCSSSHANWGESIEENTWHSCTATTYPRVAQAPLSEAQCQGEHGTCTTQYAPGHTAEVSRCESSTTRWERLRFQTAPSGAPRRSAQWRTSLSPGCASGGGSSTPLGT
jgi:hypothetical protein